MMKQRIFTTDYLASLASEDALRLSAYKKPRFSVDEKGVIEVSTSCRLSEEQISAIEKLADRSHDCAAAIKLYESLPSINYLQATDPRFWTYLAHTELWGYMSKRWSDITSDKYIRDHWFLLSRAQQPLLRHGLSGLWWGVKLSVLPDDAVDKYQLTKLFFRDQDTRARTFGTYRLGRLSEAIQGIFGYIAAHEENFKGEFEAKVRFIAKHFNGLGGTRQLAYFDKSFYSEELDRIKDQIAIQRKK